MHSRLNSFLIFVCLLFSPLTRANDISRHFEFSGSVKATQLYKHSVNANFTFELDPIKDGWEIVVRGKLNPKENLARLTPLDDGSHHNDRLIEGWNFANKEAGTSDSPREFIFSPKVGDTIQSYRESSPISETETEQVRHDGHGILQVTYFKLDARQNLQELDFKVTIDIAGDTSANISQHISRNISSDIFGPTWGPFAENLKVVQTSN